MRAVYKINAGIITMVLLVFMYLSIAQLPVEASDDSSLPSGMVIGDDEGIKVDSNGKYFVNIQDVAPGKKWSTKMTIINVEKDSPYQLTMSVSKPTLIKGSLDLSKAIQMTLIYDNQEVYKGPLSGISGTINLQDSSNPLDLGVFKSGDTRMLEAQFELDGKTYTNRDFFEKNVVENVWRFKAVKTVLPTTNSSVPSNKPFKLKLPQTGEEWRSTLIFTCLGLFLLF